MNHSHTLSHSHFFPLALRRRLAVSSLLCALPLLSGCDNLPSGGPRASAYESTNTRYEAAFNDGDIPNSELPFILVDADRKVIDSLLKSEDKSYFKGAFTDRSTPAATVLGVGDVVRVTIFEAGVGGLFVPQGGSSGGNYITLPDQEVDQTGSISVPYAGKNGENGIVPVNGKTTAEVQHDIQKRLLNKAIEPQVIVSLVKRTSNMFSVIGDVGAPGRFNIDHTGIRILDALSTAGGPKGSDFNTLVTLQRGSTAATARLSTVMRESENNIFIQPGDLLAVKRDERYYNVLGSTKNNSRIAFESETVTLADALAKAGGLDTENSDPSSVVIFRREEGKNLINSGIPVDGFSASEPVPTVYRFDLRTPTGMFLAQKMQIRSDDAVFVSKHGFSDVKEISKLLYDALLLTFIRR